MKLILHIRKTYKDELSCDYLQIAHHGFGGLSGKLYDAVDADAVFFDALHQYEPVRDEIAWAKGIEVACICGHDYNNPSPVFGVTRAVDEVFPNGVDVCGMCWKGR